MGYISLDQARVLAIEHARDNTDFYGPNYAGMNLVWEMVSKTYYTVSEPLSLASKLSPVHP